MSKAIEINERANGFLAELSNLLDNINYDKSFVETKYNSILECISKKLKKSVSAFDLSISTFPEIYGGWEHSDYSEMLGSYLDDWLNINLESKEIEIHNPDYYYMDLFYKVANNEDSFLKLFLELAKIIGQYGYDKNYFENKLLLSFNIYQRRVLSEKFAHEAGGEIYYEFWKNYWIAWPDEEIFEAGPIGYDLDLPDTIKQEGDKYVWV